MFTGQGSTGPDCLAGFRARTTGYFCFGKSNQNHPLQCAALRVPCDTRQRRQLRNSLRSDRCSLSLRRWLRFSAAHQSHKTQALGYTPNALSLVLRIRITGFDRRRKYFRFLILQSGLLQCASYQPGLHAPHQVSGPGPGLHSALHRF